MKVLVTGANGFLGRNLVPLLKENHTVIPVHRRAFNCAVLNSEAMLCDLLNQDDVESMIRYINPDVIIHAAGSVGGIGANKENPGKFIYENLQMGMNVIHTAMENKVSKFIMIGTVCSYPKFTPVPFCEYNLWNGYPEETNAPYGIAKKTLIEMLAAYRQQYGLNSVSLLPANMYGPHDHFNLDTSHVIPALILKIDNAIKNKESSITVWGDGSPTREFLYVEDCCRAIMNAIEFPLDIIPPVNIGTGVETCIGDLVDMLCDIMDYSGEVIFDETKPNGQPRRCLDVASAKHLGLVNNPTSLYSGLTKTIEWFRKACYHTEQGIPG